jgi:hypothetical protein
MADDDYPDPTTPDPGVTPAPQPAPAPDVAPAPATPSPGEDIQQLLGARQAALRASLAQGVTQKPEEYARTLATAAQLGVDPGLVQRNQARALQNAKLQGIDVDGLATKHPELTEWLSNRDNAALAHDDTGSLRSLDTFLAHMDGRTDVTGTLPAGYIYLRTGEIARLGPDGKNAEPIGDRAAVANDLRQRGNAAAAAEMDHQEAADRIDQQLGALAGPVAVGANFLSGFRETWGRNTLADEGNLARLEGQFPRIQNAFIFNDLTKFAGSIASSGPFFEAGAGISSARATISLLSRMRELTAPILGDKLAAFGATQAKVVAGMAPANFATAAHDYDENGSASHAALNFLISSATVGAIPAGGFGQKLFLEGHGAPLEQRALAQDGNTGVARSVLSSIGLQATQGAVQSLGNAINDAATAGVPMDPWKILHEMALQGALGGVMGAAFGLGPAVGQKHAQEAIAAHAGIEHGEKLAQIIQTLQQSPLNERSPEAMQSAMKAMSPTSGNIYMQAKEWQEHWLAAGEDPVAHAEAAGAGTSYREAQATGGEMQIPALKFMQEAAKAKDPSRLINAARVASGAPSAAEGHAILSGKADEIAAQYKTLAEAAAHEAVEGSPETDRIHQEVLNQIFAAAPHFTPEQADHLATVVSTLYGTQAKLRGKSALDIYRSEFPLEILSSHEAQASVAKIQERMAAVAAAGDSVNTHVEALAKDLTDLKRTVERMPTETAQRTLEAAPEMAAEHIKSSYADVAGFKTAKGSTYTLDRHGRTQRTKSDHSKEGHDKGDVGLKRASDKTYYMDAEDAKIMGGHQGLIGAPGHGLGVIVKDGRAYPVAWNEAAGKWGVSPDVMAGYALSEKPEVGKAPLELWKSKSGKPDMGQGDLFTNWHPGNAITEVHGRGSYDQSPRGRVALPSEAEDLHHGDTLRGAWRAAHGEKPNQGDKSWQKLVAMSRLVDLATMPKGEVRKQLYGQREALDTSALQPETRAWLGKQPPEIQAKLAESVAYLKANPDPKGELGNLKMLAEIQPRQKPIQAETSTLYHVGHALESGQKMRADHRGLVWFSDKDTNYGAKNRSDVTVIKIPSSRIAVMDNLDGYHNASLTKKILDLTENGSKEEVFLAAEKLGYLAVQRGADISMRPETAEKYLTPAHRMAQETRGSMEFGNNRFTMKLGKSADVSTVIHEMMHQWVEVMGELAQRPDTAPQIKDDYQKLLDFSGYGTHANKLAQQAESLALKSQETRTADEAAKVAALDAPHEKLAEAFEAYFQEGRAPSPELRSLFSKIKDWMLNIYGSLRSLLSDDVRGVFDRMLAAGDAVDAAAHEQGMEPAITPEMATAAGWGAEKFAAYTKRAEELRAQAKDKAQRDAMREYRKTLTRDYREKRAAIQEDVSKDVADKPVYTAISALQDGEGPRGEPLPEADRDGVAIPKWKLDKADLVAHYGESILEQLPGPGHGRNPGRHMYTTEDGLPLARAAELLSYKTADELVRDLRDAPARAAAVKSETDARMAKLYPDALKDGSLPEDAMDALHSKGRADLDEQEMKALADLANGLEKQETKAKKKAIFSPVPLKVMRAYAAKAILEKRQRDLNPDQYRRAEAIAHKSMMDSIVHGDYEQAAAAKQRKILNGELYKAARKAQEKTQAIRDHVAETERPAARERIGKAGGWEWTVHLPDGTSKTFPDQKAAALEARANGNAPYERTSSYLDQMDAIKAQYEFAKVSQGQLNRRQSLRDWIQARQDAGQPVAIPESVLNDATQVNWRELPVQRLYDVDAALRNIEKIARLKNQLLSRDAKGTFRENVDGAVETIPANLRNARVTENSRGMLGGWKDAVSTYINKMYRVHDIVRRLDGHETGGKFYELWERPMDHAANHEQEMNAEDIGDFNRALDEYGKVGAFKNIGLHTKEYIPEINEGLSKWTQIMVAYNWGNEGNRARLMEGHKWTANQVGAILSHLDAHDKALVHAMWKLTSKRRSEVGALEERVHGEAPEWVAASPFQTKEGTWDGGYAPIVYDYSRAQNPKDVAAKEDFDLLAGRGAGYAMTSHGYTKERSEGLGLPLKLELDAFTNHLAKVNRDLAWRESLMDANRILRDKSFADGVTKALGKPALDQFQAQLDAVAATRRDTPVGFERVLGYLRQGSNAAMRSFNVAGTMMQLAGLPFTIPRVGLGNWIKAMGDMFSPESWRYVHEQSTVMKYRNAERGKLLNESLNRTSAMSALRVFPDTAYFTMNKAWAVLDTHAWYAAYHKAMAEHGGDEAKARDLADSSVSETQGATHTKDQAQALRGGELAKIFTNNMSWANANFNLMLASVQRYADKGYTKREAIQMASDMACYLIVCPMIYLAARQALTGQDLDELHDGKKLAQHVGGEAIYTLLSSVPIGRDIASVAQSGGRMDRIQGTSGLAAIGNAVGAISTAVQSAMDDKEHPHQERPGLSPVTSAAIRASGVLLHFPSAQVLHTLQGWYDAEARGLGTGGTIQQLLMGKPAKE